MAISEHESGSQTATLDTEHTLNTTTPNTTDGIYQLVVDVNAVAAGDVVIFRIKEKCRSGDTQRLAWEGAVGPTPPTQKLWVSPTLILLHGWDMTLEQTDGTGRAFPWSIRKVA